MKKQSIETTRREPGQEQALIKMEPKEERQPISWNEGVEYIAKRLTAKTLSRDEQSHLELAFRDNPKLWRIAGDMTLHTEKNLIERMSNQAVVVAAINRGVQEMRDKLGQSDAPMLEWLLIDQVILCWLNLNQVQRVYDQQMSLSLSITLAMYWEKRLTMAQTRYQKAIETLAKIRRLSSARPLQVNIGGQQINVAGAKGE